MRAHCCASVTALGASLVVLLWSAIILYFAAAVVPFAAATPLYMQQALPRTPREGGARTQAAGPIRSQVNRPLPSSPRVFAGHHGDEHQLLLVQFEQLLTARSSALYASNPWTPVEHALDEQQTQNLKQDIAKAATIASSLRQCPPTWSFTLHIRPRSTERARVLAVQIGPLHFLFRLYQATGCQEARSAMLNLLANTDCAFDFAFAPLPFGAADDLPLMAHFLQAAFRDTDLVNAVLEGSVCRETKNNCSWCLHKTVPNGVPVTYERGCNSSRATNLLRPMVNLPPPRTTTHPDDFESHSAFREGFSYLHLLSAGGLTAIGVVKEMLKAVSIIAQNGHCRTLREAYELMDVQFAGEAKSYGKELMTTVYESHWRWSAHFRRVVEKWDTASVHCASQAATPAAECRRDFFTSTEVRWEDGLKVAEDHFLAYLNNFFAAAPEIGDDVELQMPPPSRRNVLHILVLQQMPRGIERLEQFMLEGYIAPRCVANALTQRQGFSQETPLHLAFDQLEMGLDEQGTAASLLHMVLAVAKLALRFEDREPHIFSFGTTLDCMTRLRELTLELQPRAAKLALLCEADHTVGDNTASEWLFGKRVHVANCTAPHPPPLSVLELNELPSVQEMRLLLRQRQIVLIRGGGNGFDALGDTAAFRWTPGELSEKFGDIEVEVGTIPFQSQFTGSKHLQALSEFVALANGTSAETCSTASGAPYFFSRVVTAENPAILLGATELHSYLRQVGGDELIIDQGENQLFVPFVGCNVGANSSRVPPI